MSDRAFSMSDAIRFGWDTMKDHIGFFIGILVVAFLIEKLPGMVASFANREFPVVSFLLHAAGWMLGFIVQMGLIKISLEFCDGRKGKLDDLLSSFHILLPFIAGSILYALIIIGGFILFIVPGIIWGVKFSLFPYFIVDRGYGPIEALKASAKATSGAKWDLFLFGLLIGLINVVGVLCLFIGLFATIPASMVAYAHVYRGLAGEGTEREAGVKGAMYINLET